MSVGRDSNAGLFSIHHCPCSGGKWSWGSENAPLLPLIGIPRVWGHGGGQDGPPACLEPGTTVGGIEARKGSWAQVGQCLENENRGLGLHPRSCGGVWKGFQQQSDSHFWKDPSGYLGRE